MMHKTLSLMALMVVLAAPAVHASAPMVLKPAVTDADGRITLGDLFDNAGAAADVVVGTRQGATAVLDAGAVQSMAARSGATWDNPRGLRRIIVTAGPDGVSNSVVAAANQGQPAVAVARAVLIRRGEPVAVTWSSATLSLTMTGLAQKDAALGDLIQIQNPQSKQMIDAVVTGSGQAATGPAALQTRTTLLSQR